MINKKFLQDVEADKELIDFFDSLKVDNISDQDLLSECQKNQINPSSMLTKYDAPYGFTFDVLKKPKCN